MNNLIKIIDKTKKLGPKFHLKKLEKEVKVFENELPKISNNILEDLFLIKEKMTEIPKCPICNNNRMFRNYKKGYRSTCHSKKCRDKNCANSIKSSFLEKYGVENPSLVKDFQKKRENTFLEKYNVKNPYQATEVKEKIKETFIKKYGTDNPNKSTEVKNKIKKTNLEKYGVDNTYQISKVKKKIKDKFGDNFGWGSEYFKSKSKETCQEKYGINHPGESKEFHEKISKTQEEKYGGRGFKSKEINEKIKKNVKSKYGYDISSKSPIIKSKIIDTCLERYGERHPMQNIQIFEKNSKKAYKWKSIKFNGGIVSVQGYEPYAIQYLLNCGYLENDLFINNSDINEEIGKIYYIDSKDKKHRYYPDIYIKSENKIIEVKSEYTYRKNESINLLKRQACLDRGLNFEFLIINDKFLKENNLIE